MNGAGHPKLKCLLFVVISSIVLGMLQYDVIPFSSVEATSLSESHEPTEKYVVLFDAGSSGTRLHVFQFVSNSKGYVSLENEYYERIPIALSRFSRYPHKAGNAISQLIKNAAKNVPKDKWNTTVVALKATAGLRAMPDAYSNAILDEVHEALKNSPFVCAKECVSVLSGEEEGLYGWYTMNFLLGRINKGNESVAMLGIGGGSCQVSFAPLEFDQKTIESSTPMFVPLLQSEPILVYSRSYLGLGTSSARKSILEMSSNYSGNSNNSNSNAIYSPCIHPSEKTTWEYKSKTYLIRGAKDGRYGFTYCYPEAVRFLGTTVHKPKELKKRKIYAVSSHFINTIVFTLLKFEFPGSFTVGEFVKSCKFHCNYKKSLETFTCIDCSYIAALLQYSLGLEVENKIKYTFQIDGKTTSWCLGAALNML